MDSKLLQKRYEEKVQSSGLGPDEMRKLKFKPLTAKEAEKALTGLPLYRGGFLIPYFDFKGKPTSFWRFRYLEETRRGFDAQTDRKPIRYAQPAKSTSEIYLPPLLNWEALRADTSKKLIITEGELKAACAARFSFPTIGLGGVWSWRSAKAGLPILPQLEEIDWRNRDVIICFDSDAVNNHKVAAAENALARKLTEKGAAAFIARLPAARDGKKQGLDDFIVAEGAEEFSAVLGQSFEWKASADLHQLNEEVVYAQNPGLIVRLDTLQKITPRAFYEHAYSTRVYYEKIETEKGVKITEKCAAKEWLKWPHRATVRCVTYAPGEPKITAATELNVWAGWGCEPVKGNVRPWKELLDFVFRGLSPENRKWVEQWMAYPIQYPGTKLYSAVVIWGLVHGTGKSTIGYALGEIYGKNFAEIADKDLLSTHNEWAENKQFVMGDEITGGDKRSSADRMKGMITQRQLRLNIKYIPSYPVPDCINYFFTSNHPDAFFLEDTDRRFFIHEVVGEPMPFAFYTAFLKWLREEGGREALFYYLANLDLSGFNPQGPAPMTASKEEMIENGKSDIGAWVLMLRSEPLTALRLNGQVIDRDLWTTSELLRLYDPAGSKRVTLNGLSRELRRAGIEKAYNGMPIPTFEGSQKLWIIQHAEKYHNLKAAHLARYFAAERGRKEGKF